MRRALDHAAIVFLCLFAAATVGGCLDGGGNVLPVHGGSAPYWEPIEDVWGVEVWPVPLKICAVDLHPLASDERIECAGVEDAIGCQKDRREIHCRPGDTVCAHEVGHVAGLDHDSDNANVMHLYTGSDTTETTSYQRRKVRKLARRLMNCQLFLP